MSGVGEKYQDCNNMSRRKISIVISGVGEKYQDCCNIRSRGESIRSIVILGVGEKIFWSIVLSGVGKQ